MSQKAISQPQLGTQWNQATTGKSQALASSQKYLSDLYIGILS
jgi:hypothetical protein